MGPKDVIPLLDDPDLNTEDINNICTMLLTPRYPLEERWELFVKMSEKDMLRRAIPISRYTHRRGLPDIEPEEWRIRNNKQYAFTYIYDKIKKHMAAGISDWNQHTLREWQEDVLRTGYATFIFEAD
jgi:hypothetical protein